MSDPAGRPPLTCDAAQALLEPGAAADPAARSALAEHLAGCAGCRALAASEERLRRALAADRTLAPSRALQAALLEVPRRERRRRALVPLLLPLAGLVCAASTALVWLTLPGGTPPPVAQATPTAAIAAAERESPTRPPDAATPSPAPDATRRPATATPAAAGPLARAATATVPALAMHRTATPIALAQLPLPTGAPADPTPFGPTRPAASATPPPEKRIVTPRETTTPTGPAEEPIGTPSPPPSVPPRSGEIPSRTPTLPITPDASRGPTTSPTATGVAGLVPITPSATDVALPPVAGTTTASPSPSPTVTATATATTTATATATSTPTPTRTAAATATPQ
jgi:hypothetical protein